MTRFDYSTYDSQNVEMNEQIEVLPDADGVRIAIKVVPGASRSKVQGVWQRALRVAIAAPPENGKANAEVVEFIAKLFGVRRRDVTIVRGMTNPHKTIAIQGIDIQTARLRIANALKP